MDNLPVYKINIADLKHGVDKISIVEEPAIEENFFKFSLDNTSYSFHLASEEQQKLIGALLIPDKPIYRNDDKLGEYYVVFEKDTIEEIAKRYNSRGMATKFNLEHEKDVSGVVLQENWIVEDEQFDKTKAFNLSYPVGTWVGLAKIDDEELWNTVKENFNGFSVELLSSLKLSKEEPKPTDQEMLDWLSDKGENIEEYENSDEWELLEGDFNLHDEDIDNEFAITSKPNQPSKYDNENYRTRYRYTGGRVKENTRQFCREMMTTHKSRIFRYEDINAMSFRRENEDFGFYSIWRWKGSYNCRHRWKKLLFKKINAKGTNKPATPPNEQLAETRQNKNSIQTKHINKQVKMINISLKLEAVAKTVEGVEVYTPTQIEVGATLFVGNEESGEFAPTGEHALEDGTIVIVGEEGAITEVIAPTTEEEPAMMEEQLSEEEEKPEAEVKKLSDEIMEKVRELVNSQFSKVGEMIKDEVKTALSENTPAESVESNFSEEKSNGKGIFPAFNNKRKR